MSTKILTKTHLPYKCEKKLCYHTQQGEVEHGIPNLILHKDGQNFRVRAELLLFKGDKLRLMKEDHKNHYGLTYKLPGGGIDRENELIEDAAIRECEEELGIIPQNVRYSGKEIVTIYAKDKIPEWHKTCLWPDGIRYDGGISFVCVGEYRQPYKGYVKKVDRDTKQKVNSHWYTYAECKDFLHPVHRELFKRYLEEITLSGKIALQEDALVKESLNVSFLDSVMEKATALPKYEKNCKLNLDLENFNRWMRTNFQYGKVVNGKAITNSDDFSNYRTISPKDFEFYKTGVCWDYVEYEAMMFQKKFHMRPVTHTPRDKEFALYYMQHEDPDHKMPTHTWLACGIGSMLYAFEVSWSEYAKVWLFVDEEEMLRNYLKWQKETYLNRNIHLKHPVVFRYAPRKTYGIDPETYMKYIVHRDGVPVPIPQEQSEEALHESIMESCNQSTVLSAVGVNTINSHDEMCATMEVLCNDKKKPFLEKIVTETGKWPEWMSSDQIEYVQENGFYDIRNTMITEDDIGESYVTEARTKPGEAKVKGKLLYRKLDKGIKEKFSSSCPTLKNVQTGPGIKGLVIIKLYGFGRTEREYTGEVAGYVTCDTKGNVKDMWVNPKAKNFGIQAKLNRFVQKPVIESAFSFIDQTPTYVSEAASESKDYVRKGEFLYRKLDTATIRRHSRSCPAIKNAKIGPGIKGLVILKLGGFGRTYREYVGEVAGYVTCNSKGEVLSRWVRPKAKSFGIEAKLDAFVKKPVIESAVEWANVLESIHPKYYRVLYDNQGVYSELKKQVGYGWKDLKEDPAISWLPTPNIEYKDHLSYFTQKGYDTFRTSTLPLIYKHLDRKKLKVISFDRIPGKSVYQDPYQVIITEESFFPVPTENEDFE